MFGAVRLFVVFFPARRTRCGSRTRSRRGACCRGRAWRLNVLLWSWPRCFDVLLRSGARSFHALLLWSRSRCLRTCLRLRASGLRLGTGGLRSFRTSLSLWHVAMHVVLRSCRTRTIVGLGWTHIVLRHGGSHGVGWFAGASTVIELTGTTAVVGLTRAASVRRSCRTYATVGFTRTGTAIWFAWTSAGSTSSALLLDGLRADLFLMDRSGHLADGRTTVEASRTGEGGLRRTPVVGAERVATIRQSSAVVGFLRGARAYVVFVHGSDFSRTRSVVHAAATAVIADAVGRLHAVVPVVVNDVAVVHVGVEADVVD